MVTKTISMNDETFIKIKNMSEQMNTQFSTLCELLIKRGLAYTAMLESKKE